MPNVGNCGEVYYSVPTELPHTHCVLGPNALLLRSTIVENRFLYYWFQGSDFQYKLSKITSSTGQTKFNKTNLKKLEIPIPPVAVQEEVVRVLDKFTALEAELEAELDCRKRQYQYYRDALLTFDLSPSDGLCHSPLFSAPFAVEWLPLGEVAEIKGRIGFRGYTRRDFVEKLEGAITISPSNIIDQQLVLDLDKCSFVSWEKYEESPEIQISEGDVLLAKTASIGKVALVKALPHKATINPQLVVLKEIECDPAYLTYFLATSQPQATLRRIAGTGSVASISQANLKKIEIPIPPLEVQARIVEILDKFDTLVNSISEGLPREIELRRKQYEYYRDALLSF